MRRRRMLAVLLPLLAGLLCWTGIAAAQQRVFTDDAGRQVVLPERIDRVMAAGPPASVLLYALAPEKMISWVREPSAEAKAFLAPPYRDLPAHGRLTGKPSTANAQTVAAAKPDLILDVGTIDQTYAALADRIQKETGIAYVLIDGAFERMPGMLREVGSVLGVEKTADELARYAEATLSRLTATVAAIPAHQRPRVYFARGDDGLETSTAGSINAEILAAVGAVNVADAAPADGHAKVTLEQVRSWNPDVILALGPDALESTADPAWSGIAAVANREVHLAPALPFGWLDGPPGVNRLIGAAWLTSILYPGKVGADLSRDTYDFYRLFYHVDLTQDRIDGLLAGSVRK